LASHGTAVLAPDTPKATIEASSVPLESVTVITTADSCDVAIAYQTSTSLKGWELIDPEDLFAKVNPEAVVELTVLRMA
jgi:hypothetical protein